MKLKEESSAMRGYACGKLVLQDKGRNKYYKLHKRYCEVCREAGDEPAILLNPKTVEQMIQGPVKGFDGVKQGWEIHPDRVPLEVYEYSTPDRTLWEQMMS